MLPQEPFVRNETARPRSGPALLQPWSCLAGNRRYRRDFHV